MPLSRPNRSEPRALAEQGSHEEELGAADAHALHDGRILRGRRLHTTEGLGAPARAQRRAYG